MSILENCKAKISEITELLHNESVMLSEGRMSDLDIIVTQKSEAMSSLNKLLGQLNNEQDTSAIIPQIRKLQKLAKDNGLILESVMRGVRSGLSNCYLAGKSCRRSRCAGSHRSDHMRLLRCGLLVQSRA